MTAMDDALAELQEAHRRAGAALDLVRQCPDQRQQADELRGAVGTLHSLAENWERERDRWR